MNGIGDKFLPPQTSVDGNAQESKYGTNKKDGVEDGDLHCCCQHIGLFLCFERTNFTGATKKGVDPQLHYDFDSPQRNPTTNSQNDVERSTPIVDQLVSAQ